jgi:tRNA A-37 threonylcarbamoyl transferase component Bud32/dienelactone hydrolase
MDPLVGALVSHYRVIEKIGAGGMGVVYLAEDLRLQRKVALKFITPESAGDAVAQRRLLREAQAASALDHPNIATVHEVGDYQEQLFIAMAYYSGETLKQRLERGRMPIDEIATIASHIAEGLAAAHDADVTHRDLKPANVFLTSSGQVKILDFGLAQVDTPSAKTTTGLTNSTTTIGTVAYMAPEQARNHLVDRRADIWALGVMLFEMLTGRLPFRGDTVTAMLLALATDAHPPVQSLRPAAPASFGRLVDRALVKDVERRTLQASDVVRAVEEHRDQQVHPSALRRFMARPALAIPVLVAVVAVLALAGVAGRRAWEARWARTVALPEMTKLVEALDYSAAFDLAGRAQPLLADSEEFRALWPRMTRVVNVSSEPPGASVSYLPYGRGGEWRLIGTTPVKDVRVPLGTVRIRVDKEGFEPAEDVVVVPVPGPLNMKLYARTDTPEGMVRADAIRGNFSIFLFGLETPRVKLNGFWIDRHEVTNRQYREFVDAGGYRRQEFWRHPIIKDGRAIPFDDAVGMFRDATGRPGPSTWAQGSYAPGQDDVPVGGVSWYEAAAYAAFAGRALPTAYHWYWVANQSLLITDVIPLSTFNASAPTKVSDSRALHRFGAYGFAGNIKEWCVNEAPGDRRYVLGGGFDEPPYMFRDTDARSPLLRDANLGFRTVKYDEGDSSVAPLKAMLTPPSRSYDSEKPVSDEVYQAYRRLYTYDRRDLESKVEAVDEQYPDWKVEIISFSAAYGPERMLAYIMVPKKGTAPFQPIVFMPGSGAWDSRSRPNFSNPVYAFLMRSGRAVVIPVYKGAWERANNEYNGGDQLKSTTLWRDYIIFFAKDIGRSLDYLETRKDMDLSKVGFLGNSRGGALSPMMLTAEKRIRSAVLWINGLYLEKIAPEADAINFAPHVTIPVLQLNGRYDYNFPPALSSDPFFTVLGTPAEHKRRVLYDTGHNLPPNESIRETLDWFDKYLGVPH